MSQLFTSLSLRSLTLSSRIVVSPMDQYCAENGNPKLWHTMHYASLAISGAGLVVLEGTAVEDIAGSRPMTSGSTATRTKPS